MEQILPVPDRIIFSVPDRIPVLICNTEFLLPARALQVSMAEHGFDVQCSKKASDASRRRHIFDIISQYCFSNAEIAKIVTYSDAIQDLWLQSFTNSQSVMVKSKLLQSAMEYFRTFSPDDTMAPRPSKAKRIGLPSAESILDR